MLKNSCYSFLYIALTLLFFTNCKPEIKIDCPPFLKITNATGSIVDLNFYNQENIVETINIQSKSYFVNEASDDNEYGMPQYFYDADSVEMVFDGGKSLVYKQNQSLTDKNILRVNDYIQSKSKNICNNSDELVYNITSEHLYVAN
jgi:hypothetical protein